LLFEHLEPFVCYSKEVTNIHIGELLPNMFKGMVANDAEVLIIEVVVLEFLTMYRSAVCSKPVE